MTKTPERKVVTQRCPICGQLADFWEDQVLGAYRQQPVCGACRESGRVELAGRLRDSFGAREETAVNPDDD